MISFLDRTALTVCGIHEIDIQAYQRYSHVLSMIDPGQMQFAALLSCSAHYRIVLEFHDIIGPAQGWVEPNEDHIRLILGFGESLLTPLRQSKFCNALIHCNMGISRSTAALAIMLAQADQRMEGHKIFELVSLARPQAWPNSLMIDQADDVLGRGGNCSKRCVNFMGVSSSGFLPIKDISVELGEDTKLR